MLPFPLAPCWFGCRPMDNGILGSPIHQTRLMVADYAQLSIFLFPLHRIYFIFSENEPSSLPPRLSKPNIYFIMIFLASELGRGALAACSAQPCQSSFHYKTALPRCVELKLKSPLSSFFPRGSIFRGGWISLIVFLRSLSFSPSLSLSPASPYCPSIRPTVKLKPQ